MDSAEQEERKSAQETQPVLESQEQRKPTPWIVRALVIVLFAMVCLGIYNSQIWKSDSNENSFKNDLQKLGLSYHEFHRVNERSPSSIDELIDFMNHPPPPPKQTSIVVPDSISVVLIPTSIQDMIREGQLIVIWDAVLTNSGQENDKYLLAYVDDSASKGGFVLTAAGRALELTADTFKQYPLVLTSPETKETEN